MFVILHILLWERRNSSSLNEYCFFVVVFQGQSVSQFFQFFVIIPMFFNFSLSLSLSLSFSLFVSLFFFIFTLLDYFSLSLVHRDPRHIELHSSFLILFHYLRVSPVRWKREYF